MKVAEILREGLIQQLNHKVERDLNAALEKKGANIAKAEVVTSPEGNDHVRVKMNTKGGALTRAAVRNVLDDYLRDKFSPGNLLGIDYSLSLAGVKNSYHIYLRQVSNEALDPILAKVYGRIYDIISNFNHDWWKDFGDKQHYLFDLSAHYSDHLLTFRLTRDTNFDFELFYEGIERIKEELEEHGLLNGMMPIDIEFSRPYGDPVKVDITVERSGPRGR